MTVEGAGELSLPADVVDDLLYRGNDLAEMKAVLFVLEITARRGTPGIWFDDLIDARILNAVAGASSPQPAEERLRSTLDRAVTNGFLYRLVAPGRRLYYLPASHRNRELVHRLRQGESDVRGVLDLPPDTEVAIYRPNVYTVYEQHIGPLTPLVAEQLRSAERAYPRGWIEQAIITAAHNNRRSWRYIESVLLRWEETGAPNGV